MKKDNNTNNQECEMQIIKKKKIKNLIYDIIEMNIYLIIFYKIYIKNLHSSKFKFYIKL